MYSLNMNTLLAEKEFKDYNANYRSVRIHVNILKKLDSLGKFKESYSELIGRLISEKLGLEVSEDNRSY